MGFNLGLPPIRRGVKSGLQLTINSGHAGRAVGVVHGYHFVEDYVAIGCSPLALLLS